MKSCTFFGHRDTPEDIRYDLKQVLIDLIENKGVMWFYVGHNGMVTLINMALGQG